MARTFDQLRLTLAQQLRHKRLLQGISQEALAFRAEVDRTYVSQLERGTVNPSLRVLCQVATALDLDIVELLSAGSTT